MGVQGTKVFSEAGDPGSLPRVLWIQGGSSGRHTGPVQHFGGECLLERKMLREKNIVPFVFRSPYCVQIRRTARMTSSFSTGTRCRVGVP